MLRVRGRCILGCYVTFVNRIQLERILNRRCYGSLQYGVLFSFLLLFPPSWDFTKDICTHPLNVQSLHFSSADFTYLRICRAREIHFLGRVGIVRRWSCQLACFCADFVSPGNRGGALASAGPELPVCLFLYFFTRCHGRIYNFF